MKISPELIFHIFVGVVIAIYLSMAIAIPQQSLPQDIVEANGLPILLSGLGLVLVAFTIAETLRKKEHVDISIKKEALVRLSIVVAMVIVYINVIRQIGFITAMFLFINVCIIATGSKRYLYNVIFSLLFTIGITFIFGNLFSINLPRGQGVFMQLSWLLH